MGLVSKDKVKGTTILPKFCGIQAKNIKNNAKIAKLAPCHRVLRPLIDDFTTKGMPTKTIGLKIHMSQFESTEGCSENKNMKRSNVPTTPCVNRSNTSQIHSMW